MQDAIYTVGYIIYIIVMCVILYRGKCAHLVNTYIIHVIDIYRLYACVSRRNMKHTGNVLNTVMNTYKESRFNIKYSRVQ